MLGESVLNTTHSVGDLQRFEKSVLKMTVCMKLAEVRRVCYDHCNAYRRLAELRRVCVDHCKMCSRLAQSFS